MMEAIVGLNSPLQLVFDNVSLVLAEIISYFLFFMACIHASGSPKRTQFLLGSLVLYHTLLLGLGQLDSKLAITWHGQAIIMLFNYHVPLFTILLHASLYYLSYISVLKMRLQFISSILAMGFLLTVAIFPAELLGTRLLWWTWHDTDPSLDERFLNVPIAMFISHYSSASSFYLSLELLRHYFTPGHVFQQSIARTEYFVLPGAILCSLPCSILEFSLIYPLFHDLLGISGHIILICLLFISITMIWSSDRQGGMIDTNGVVPWHFDGEWHHPWYDHALLQSFLLYLFLTPIILAVVNPAHLISLGYHQLLGDCSDTTSSDSIFGTTQLKFTYLCHYHYDEIFSFCGVPRSQLHVNDPWYKICGVSYTNGSFNNSIAILLAGNISMFLLFKEIFSTPRPIWVRRFLDKKEEKPVRMINQQ